MVSVLYTLCVDKQKTNFPLFYFSLNSWRSVRFSVIDIHYISIILETMSEQKAFMLLLESRPSRVFLSRA